MKGVKILGPGCKRCDAVEQIVRDAAARARDGEGHGELAGQRIARPVVASTLVHGDSGLASFTREALDNEAARALARRVRVHEEPAYTAMMPARRWHVTPDICAPRSLSRGRFAQVSEFVPPISHPPVRGGARQTATQFLF